MILNFVSRQAAVVTDATTGPLAQVTPGKTCKSKARPKAKSKAKQSKAKEVRHECA